MMAMGGGGGSAVTHKLYRGSRLTGGDVLYGYSLNNGDGNFGSLSPTKFLTTTIKALQWNDTDDKVQITVANPAIGNAGWSNMRIGSTDFARASATYLNGKWTWTGITTNPFPGANGVTHDISFTY